MLLYVRLRRCRAPSVHCRRHRKIRRSLSAQQTPLPVALECESKTPEDSSGKNIYSLCSISLFVVGTEFIVFHHMSYKDAQCTQPRYISSAMNISEVSEFDVGLARRASCMPHFKLRRRGTRHYQHRRPHYEVHSNAKGRLQRITQKII